MPIKNFQASQRAGRRGAAISASDIILENAIDFLNVGLDLLFGKRVSGRESKVAVVAIQTAIELFGKYRLMQASGIQSIVRGNIPEHDVLGAAQRSQFKTIGFNECLKELDEIEGFSETDRELMRELQNLRNSLIHFAAEVDTESLRNTCAWLLIRILAMFAAGDERDIGEFQDHRRFLDAKNFSTLIRFGPYRAEAVDVASEDLDSDEVFRCWECGNDTLCLRSSETYFCYCCGLTVGEDAVSFAGCSECKIESGVFYDPLNSTDGLHQGRCLFCDIWMHVWICEQCGEAQSLRDKAASICCTFCETPDITSP